MNGGGLRAALALSAALCASLALTFLLGTARIVDYGAGLAFNVCAFGFAWLVSEALARARVPEGLVLSGLAVVVACMSGLVLAHGYFFDVAIERRLTLLDITLSGLGHFFSVTLPRRGLLVFLGLYAAIATGAVALGARLRGPTPRVLAAMAVVLSALLWGVLRAPRIASPLFDSAHELHALAVRPRVQPADDGPRADRLASLLDKSARTNAQGAPRFSKVIVVVMETMTARTFANERAALSKQAFFERERARFHDFERYYPNNQDSRTGMLDMLFSRLVPYEAYSEDGYRGYRYLANRPSLVDRMRALSFETAFAVSQTALEEVASELSWDATLWLEPAEITAAKAAGKLCFTPDEYEQSCEDLTLLPKVVDFVARNERAFVYQEMIWGHAYEYNAASGLSNTAYYAAYLDALTSALAARGLLDDTLIAVTSDHGFRDKGQQHDPEAYRVPLTFYATGFEARRDARLTSHSDFGMLLLEELVPGAARADDNPFVMIVGPTGQGHTFVVDRAGGHLLLWQRLGPARVLALREPLGQRPEALLAAFLRYRARFDQAGLGLGE